MNTVLISTGIVSSGLLSRQTPNQISVYNDIICDWHSSRSAYPSAHLCSLNRDYAVFLKFVNIHTLYYGLLYIIRFFPNKVVTMLALLLLNRTCPVLANSVDPDQMASEEDN